MRSISELFFICVVILASWAQAFTAQAQGKSLNFTPIKKESVAITGKIVGKYFLVEFSTINGTVPAVSKSFIAAFGDQQIPYYQNIRPVVIVSAQCDSTYCSQAVEAPITAIPYIVGIGSSASINTISATLHFFPGTSEGVPFKSSVNVEAVDINTIIVSYVMPDGYRPTASGAWIGIWEGDKVNSIQIFGKAKIDSDQASGTQAINGLKISSQATYTVGLASGPDANDMVSSATFTISPD